MQRIRLTRSEKQLLRNIAAGVSYWPDTMSCEAVSCAVAELERHGLIRVAWASGHIVAAAELTDFGTAYVLANPHLRNPVECQSILGSAIAIATLAVVIVALLTACYVLYQIQ